MKPTKGTLEAARLQIRSLNRRKSYGHCLFRLSSPPMRIPPQADNGGLILKQTRAYEKETVGIVM